MCLQGTIFAGLGRPFQPKIPNSFNISYAHCCCCDKYIPFAKKLANLFGYLVDLFLRAILDARFRKHYY
jgi:hypothetical protein